MKIKIKIKKPKKRRLRTRHMPTKVFEKDDIKVYIRRKKHKKKISPEED